MDKKTKAAFAVSTLAFLLFVSPLVAAAGDNVVRATLGNGLRVVIVPSTLAPVVTTEVVYLVGSVEAPKDFPGTAHALEHMMFRGNPGLSSEQFSAISAALGGNMNAGTSQVTTGYHLTVPSDALSVALRVESIRMRGVLAREKDWEKERGAIEQEVSRDLSNPRYSFYIRLLAEMYAGTPYDHTALGTRPSFQKTTGAMLKRFYRDWYSPNNAILVIAGDVDPAGTLIEVKRLFSPIPSRRLPPRPKFEVGPLRPARIAMDTDLPHSQAVVAYRLPGYSSADFAAGVILADVLDSRRGELYALVTQGKALSSNFRADALPKSAFGYAEVSFPKGGEGEALIGRIKEIVSGYVKNGVPADLVEAARRREISQAEFTKNSVSGLASDWAQALAVEGRNSPDDDIEAIRKVTVEDVNRVAAKYLVNDTAVTALLTPSESEKPVATGGYSGKESFAAKQTKDVEIPAWAKKSVETPTAPPSRVNPVDLTLPNGLRLIVQPESVSPTVTLVGRIRTEPKLQTPPGKEGVARVLDGLFPYGTKTLDRTAYQKALDDIGADASAGTSFSLRVLMDHFDRGVELLAGNLLEPALPAEAFAVVRDETADAVAGELQSPSYRSDRALHSALLPPGDPVLRETTRETVTSLTLEDIRTYREKVFRPDLATIVIIGQVTPEQAREVVGRHFGGWKAAGPKPETDLPPVPSNKPSVAEVPNPVRVQSDVKLSHTLNLTRFNPDFYPLRLGMGVLAGGFYAARLYRDLREKSGLVYFVDAELNAGRTRSDFSVDYACDPANVSKAHALVVRDLEEMKKEPVSPAELRQAKVMFLHALSLGESSMDRIAWNLVRFSVGGLPLDEPTRASQRYLSITAPEIRDAFARWIRPDDFVQVTEGPASR